MKFEDLVESQPLADLAKIVAERSRSLVAWIGAGLSMPGGLPSWPALRSHLHTSAVKKANTFDEPDSARTLERLNSIVGIDDPWLAFEKLAEILGNESYRTEIRRALDVSEKPRTKHYPTLFKIPWKGIISLNLDEFGPEQVRAQPRKWHQFTGVEAPRMSHILQGPHPYYGSLHGVFEKYDSWVLKKSDLREILNDEAYKQFVRAIFLTTSVVFLGISADDIAAGGFLETLSEIGLSTGGHFWITSRSDAKTDKWAEKIGIRVIRYSPANHHEQFLQILEHLASYQSLEDPHVAPLVEETAARIVAPCSQLISKSTNEIRRELNAHAAALESTKLTEFYKSYRRCIHQAWLIDLDEEKQFFDFTIDDTIGLGAFGKVYAATSADGVPVAVKILHQDVFDKPDMVNSFRRGVRSLRFLTEENLPGVVKYIEAFEIPASLVMEYVPGTTLLEAVSYGYLRDWRIRLQVATQLAAIIRSAHESPRRVLHRDIRPHNVILRNMFKSSDDIEVVVLDFDLSWHRDSTERSVYPNVEGALGYGAPEQFEDGAKGLARTSLVDSFGLGMTLFFSAIERHPKSREQEHAIWKETLRASVASQQCREWVSLPNRYVRLVTGLTKSEQASRIDFEAGKAELERLYRVFTPMYPIAASLVAEELMARAFDPNGYTWNENNDTATSPMSGGTISVIGNDKDKQVEIKITWADPGDKQRALLPQNLEAIKAFAQKRFAELGWRCSTSANIGSFDFEAEAESSTCVNRIDAVAQALEQTRSKFGAIH